MTAIPPTRLVVFGATTPSGDACLRLARAGGRFAVCAAGRHRVEDQPDLPFRFCDLSSAHSSDLSTGEGDGPAWPETVVPLARQVWISFAPIWHLAPYLERQLARGAASLAGLQAVVACSSSSVITKRFATNRFDRALVHRLQAAEAQLQSCCRLHGITCRILAPTLIYGRSGAYGDRNLSQLSFWLRRLPIVPIPRDSGMRQPIHCRQLAAVALVLAADLDHVLAAGGIDPASPQHLPIGGDETLTYRAMLERLRNPPSRAPTLRPFRAGRLLPLPSRLFYLLASPLLLASPKHFEAVLRIGADLSGFTPAHRLLEEPPQPFPAGPMA